MLDRREYANTLMLLGSWDSVKRELQKRWLPSAESTSCSAARVKVRLHSLSSAALVDTDILEAIVGTIEELASSDRTQTVVRDQFETNFFGPMNIIKAALPQLRKQRIGHIMVLGGISENSQS